MQRSSLILGGLVFALLAALPLGSPARAQTEEASADPEAAPVDRTIEAGPSGDAARREARVRFQMGVTLYEEGDFQGALAEFERANASAPSPVVLYNIAQTHLALRDYVAAVDALNRYLEEGGSRLSPERRAEVEAQLASLAMRIGRVRITANEDGASVTIDGHPIGRTPLDEPVRLSSGRHQVVIRVPERDPFEQELTIAGNVEIELRADFPPPPPRVTEGDEPARTLRTVGYLGIGTGIAGGAAALTTFGLAMGARNRYESAIDAIPADEAAARDARDDVRRLSLASDVLTGASLAIGVTGLVLVLVDRGRNEEEEDTPAAFVAPTRGGFVVYGTF